VEGIVDTVVTHRIPAGQLRRYQAAAQQRRKKRAHALMLRRERAWHVVQQAAHILKTQFVAKRVVVFGSVLSARRFHTHSDVDLAVWGLPESTYYQAVGCLQSLAPGIAVDIVEFELAPASLQAAIAHTGVPV
jgi:predicted nucleotidyltransferase